MTGVREVKMRLACILRTPAPRRCSAPLSAWYVASQDAENLRAMAQDGEDKDDFEPIPTKTVGTLDVLAKA